MAVGAIVLSFFGVAALFVLGMLMVVALAAVAHFAIRWMRRDA